jgi:hypothetical protein
MVFDAISYQLQSYIPAYRRLICVQKVMHRLIRIEFIETHRYAQKSPVLAMPSAKQIII